MSKYKHTSKIHNLETPNVMVPVIVGMFKPESVVDIGCGLGTFLHVFKNEGVNEILGVDGPWVDRSRLQDYLSLENFVEANLENEIVLDKVYDLVLSLEVAEHLSEAAAETFVKSLVNAGNIVIFSAALPMQGGQNHINEQPVSYWEKLFLQHNYVLHDILRPLFWDNGKVEYWYKQNVVVFAPVGYEFASETQPIRDIVHYELFELRSQQAQLLLEPTILSSLKLLAKAAVSGRMA